MHDPTPKITVPGRIGAFLLTLAAARLDPHLLPPMLLYGLSVSGLFLVLWACANYAAELAPKLRSQPNHPSRIEANDRNEATNDKTVATGAKPQLTESERDLIPDDVDANSKVNLLSSAPERSQRT